MVHFVISAQICFRFKHTNKKFVSIHPLVVNVCEPVKASFFTARVNDG